MNSSKTSVGEALKNPFEYIAGTKALAFGTAFLALSVLLGAFFNTRFDGVLNMHFVEDVNPALVFYDQVINFLSLAVILFLMARSFGAIQTRFIDIAGTTLLAMAPFSVLPLLNVNNYLYDTSTDLIKNLGEASLATAGIIWLILASALIIISLVWMISLLYKAYKTSTNLKGNSLVVSFIIGLLLAIVMSKYLTLLIS